MPFSTREASCKIIELVNQILKQAGKWLSLIKIQFQIVRGFLGIRPYEYQASYTCFGSPIPMIKNKNIYLFLDLSRRF